MKLIKITFIVFAFAGILASCEKEYFEKPKLDFSIPVSFSTDLQPILTSKCAGSGCHDNSYPPNLLKDKSFSALWDGGYIDTATPSLSNLMIRLNKDMPKGKLPQSDINKFEAWIIQGGKDN